MNTRFVSPPPKSVNTSDWGTNPRSAAASKWLAQKLLRPEDDSRGLDLALNPTQIQDDPGQ